MPLFLMYYIFNWLVIWNIPSFGRCWYYIPFFAELGRLYRYESRSVCLLNLR